MSENTMANFEQFRKIICEAKFDSQEAGSMVLKRQMGAMGQDTFEVSDGKREAYVVGFGIERQGELLYASPLKHFRSFHASCKYNYTGVAGFVPERLWCLRAWCRLLG